MAVRVTDGGPATGRVMRGDADRCDRGETGHNGTTGGKAVRDVARFPGADVTSACAGLRRRGVCSTVLERGP